MPDSKQLTLPGMSKAELDRLEGKIRAGLKSFVEVGHALQEIRDKRGYLIRGYKSFDQYCEREFHFSLRQGERLMLAAQTAETVKKVTGEAPANESVARVLTSVAKDEKILNKVVSNLKKRGQTIATATAEKIAEVVDQVVAKPKANGSGAEQPTPAEKAAAPILQSLSDACPGCKAVPTSYKHVPGGWECGDCGASVRLNTLPAEIVLCKECGKPLFGASICGVCGAVV